MNVRKYLVWGLVLVLFIGFVGKKVYDKQTTDAQAKQAALQRVGAAAPVSLATAGPATIVNQQELTGNVVSPNTVILAAKLAGRVDFLQVRQGDDVTADQVLVKLDPTAVNGEILTSRSELATAKARLAQALITKAANDTTVIQQINKDQAGLHSSKANYNQAVQNASAQVAAAEGAVVDAKAKVASAQSTAKSAAADLASAQANEHNLELKYNRTFTLYNQGFTASQDVDDAKAALDVAKATTNSVQSKLDAANSTLDSAKAQLKVAQDQAAIQRRVVEAGLAASKANLDQSAATVKVSDSNKSQVQAYQANIDALKAAVASAEGQLGQSESKLADTVLRAGIAGTVTSRTMDPGTIASAGAPILTVQLIDWLYVNTLVPVEFSSSVHQGDTWSFNVDGVDGTLHGVVAQVAKSADPVSRQFLVSLKVNNPNHSLKPGMFAHVHLVTQKVDAPLAVPQEAISLVKGSNLVFVFEPEGTAKAVVVTPGVRDAKMVAITGDIKPGDKVVTLTSRALKDGQKIFDASKGKGKGRGAPAAAASQGSSR